MEYISAINPMTSEPFGAVPATQPDSLKRCVQKASHAQKKWAQLTHRQRSAYFYKLRSTMLARMNEVAQTISQSTSKPLVESLTADIMGTLESIRWCVDHSAAHLKPEKPWMGRYWTLLRRSIVYRKPLGVIGIIAPWNYPLAIPMSQVLSSLISGNAVILKPSELTPMVGQIIETLFREAEFPPDVVTIIQGGKAVGEALVQSGVQKILFTGSTPVGHMVAQACARAGIPCSLELGGSDAMIVLDDAPIEKALAGVLWGGFSNCGQTCASVQRLLVHSKIYDDFTNRLKKKMSQIQMGHPQNFVDMGKPITSNQAKKIESLIQEARQKGATIFAPQAPPGHIPPMLVEVPPSHGDMPFSRNEVFGPAISITSFSTDEEAIAHANRTDYGLSTSIWSGDTKRAQNMAQACESGTVTINCVTYTHALPMTPWTGIKNSGWGASHGKWGLEEVTRPFHVHTNYEPASFKEFWWFPYSQRLFELLTDLVIRFTSPGPVAWLSSIPAFLLLKKQKKY